MITMNWVINDYNKLTKAEKLVKMHMNRNIIEKIKHSQ